MIDAALNDESSNRATVGTVPATANTTLWGLTDAVSRLKTLLTPATENYRKDIILSSSGKQITLEGTAPEHVLLMLSLSITDRVSQEGKAIGSVCPSVRLSVPLFLTLSEPTDL